MFHLVQQVDHLAAGLRSAHTIHLVGKPPDRTLRRQFLMVQKLFDPPDDLDVGIGIVPPIRPVPRGVKRRKPRFPLSKPVGRHAKHLTDFGDRVPIFRLNAHCIQSSGTKPPPRAKRQYRRAYGFQRTKIATQREKRCVSLARNDGADS